MEEDGREAGGQKEGKKKETLPLTSICLQLLPLRSSVSVKIPETKWMASVAHPALTRARELLSVPYAHSLTLILTQPYKEDTEITHEGHEGHTD